MHANSLSNLARYLRLVIELISTTAFVHSSGWCESYIRRKPLRYRSSIATTLRPHTLVKPTRFVPTASLIARRTISEQYSLLASPMSNTESNLTHNRRLAFTFRTMLITIPPAYSQHITRCVASAGGQLRQLKPPSIILGEFRHLSKHLFGLINIGQPLFIGLINKLRHLPQAVASKQQRINSPNLANKFCILTH